MEPRHRPSPASGDPARTTRLLAHLEGVLGEATLVAMQRTWNLLEDAAVSRPAYSRAVRERLVWEAMLPLDVAAAGAPTFADTDVDEDEDELRSAA